MEHFETFWSWIRHSLRKAGWAPSTVFGLYLVASLAFNAYAIYLWLDSVTHFAGGAALSYFLLDLFDNADDFFGHIPRSIRVVLVFSCVGTAAIFWEFYEFLSDYYFGTNMQHGRDDTMSDLFFGLLGSAVYLVVHKLLNLILCRKKQAIASREVGS